MFCRRHWIAGGAAITVAAFGSDENRASGLNSPESNV
jgi:hypothetical protein